jgi:hypothetical protein
LTSAADREARLTPSPVSHPVTEASVCIEKLTEKGYKIGYARVRVRLSPDPDLSVGLRSDEPPHLSFHRRRSRRSSTDSRTRSKPTSTSRTFPPTRPSSRSRSSSLLTSSSRPRFSTAGREEPKERASRLSGSSSPLVSHAVPFQLFDAFETLTLDLFSSSGFRLEMRCGRSRSYSSTISNVPNLSDSRFASSLPGSPNGRQASRSHPS